MPITRADIAGALKLLNANNTPNRRGWLQNMLKAHHPQKYVDKALADLESYADWGPRVDLETPADTSASAIPAEPKKKKK